MAQRHLADIALRQQDHREARRLDGEAVALYRQIDDQGGLATALHGLARAEVALGDASAALTHYRQALRSVAKTQLRSLQLSILADIGALILGLDWRPGVPSAQRTFSPEPWVVQPQRGIELLALARSHANSDSETKERAAQILAGYAPQGRSDGPSVTRSMPASAIQLAVQRGEEASLDDTIATLRAELSELAVTTKIDTTTELAVGEPVLRRAGDGPDQELVEALTTRDVEVLKLIAQGLSNREIAQRLVLTPGTVKWYTSQIYGKLGVHSRTQAVARAEQLNLIA